MNNSVIVFDLLTILGSLAFFLFGIKIMSESLQKVAGHKMRSYLSSITSNPWRGLFTGLLITGTLQSSSAATVMLVGFVSAGLIPVLDSVGLVLGANIGTTVTSWLITFFGFSFNIRIVLLPLIAMSIPLYFSSNSSRKSIAEFIMGFAIMFFGLQFLRDTLPEINQHSGIINFLSQQSDRGFGAILLIVLTGIVITILIQSSTASITLTMVMFSNDIISFEVASALIIGENIGTTATANIAALVANRNAKRTALIHTLFNVIGALIFLPFLYQYMQGVEGLTHFLLGTDSEQSDILKPLQISIFHSGFNIIMALILISFASRLVWLSKRIIPESPSENTDRPLAYRDNLVTSTSEISLLFAMKKLHQMGQNVDNMFGMIPVLLLEKEPERYAHLLEQLRNREDDVDRSEKEVLDYLSRLAESKLSAEGSRLVNSMMIIANNIESIADINYKMSKIIDNKNVQKAWFNQEQRNNLAGMFDLVKTSLRMMNQQLAHGGSGSHDTSLEIEDQINARRHELLEQHMKDLKESKYYVNAGTIYQQLIVYCEKIGDHSFNVSEALLKH
jgi:phosphate:Na+ symporter